LANNFSGENNMLMSKKITLTAIVLLGLIAAAAGSYYIFFVPAKNEANTFKAFTVTPMDQQPGQLVGTPADNNPNTFKAFPVTPMDESPLPQVGVNPSQPQPSQGVKP
jgi:flagellar basal body-associated protein FliL